MTTEIELKRGLQGVYIDRTQSSFIDGEAGKLLYRGYSIHDLAEKSTFEETVYLLLYGKLPNRKELDGFDAQLRANRSIPAEVMQILRLVKDAHPMDVLRTAISALSAFDPEVADNSLEATLRKGIRLTAQAPTIVTAHARIRDGKEPLEPNPGLNQAANFLYMLFGKEPTADEARLMEKDFILHAEHGINASAFAASGSQHRRRLTLRHRIRYRHIEGAFPRRSGGRGNEDVPGYWGGGECGEVHP